MTNQVTIITSSSPVPIWPFSFNCTKYKLKQTNMDTEAQTILIKIFLKTAAK